MEYFISKNYSILYLEALDFIKKTYFIAFLILEFKGEGGSLPMNCLYTNIFI